MLRRLAFLSLLLGVARAQQGHPFVIIIIMLCYSLELKWFLRVRGELPLTADASSTFAACSQTSQWLNTTSNVYTVTNLTNIVAGGAPVVPWDNTTITPNSNIGIVNSGNYTVAFTSQVNLTTLTLFQVCDPER